MNKILVENKTRVSRIIGTQLEYEEDLLNSKDKKVKEFIKKYEKYLDSVKQEDYKDFFDKTGLFITHLYKEKSNSYSIIYFNLMGVSINNQKEKGFLTDKAFNNHLLVVTEVDEINTLFNGDIVVDGKKVANTNDYKFDFSKGREIRYSIGVSNNLEEKIEYIKSIYDISYLDESKIKEVILDPFNYLFILLNDGTLYCDGKVYSENVRYLFNLDSHEYFIIYNDDRVETLTSKYENMYTIDGDKVLNNDFFMAILKQGNVVLYYRLELEIDTSIFMAYDGIDDISYEEVENCLILIKNNSKIKVPLNSIFIMNM